MTVMRVAVLDDQAAVRAGLEVMLAAEPDLVFAGAASDEAELWPLLNRTRPAVVVLDLHHDGRDGLALCLELKRRLQAPRVVLYTGWNGELGVPAAFAGADAVVAKSDTALALLSAIRTASARPAIRADMQAKAAARLDASERAIFAMQLAGTSLAEMADTLGVSPSAVAGRAEGILARLTAPEGATSDPVSGDAPRTRPPAAPTRRATVA